MIGRGVEERIRRDYQALLDVLPASIQRLLAPVVHEAEEVKMRYGRRLKIKHHGKWHSYDLIVDQDHLADLRTQIDHIRDDNRAGIDRTGHRVSRVPSADGLGTDGFNIRIARYFQGFAEWMRPYLHENPTVLIVGLAGKGKSTLLRELCRLLGEIFDANATLVDSSNEVGGDGRVPHEGIGEVDRYFVPIKAEQHKVMLEVVANNSAEIVIIDEVQTEAEAQTIRDLSAKAQFVATTHGDDPSEIIQNGPLAALFHPKPLFHWMLLVREIGVYELYRLKEVVEDVKAGRTPTPLKTFEARVQASSGVYGGNELEEEVA